MPDKHLRVGTRHLLRRQRNLERLEQRCLLAADVYISEFLASNDSGLLDADGDSSDWVEVFNAGPDDVNLDGWHLTDDIDERGKWSFPEQTLPAGNALLVFASGKDRAIAGEQLHTDFKLSAGGEYLGLTRTSDDGLIEVVSSYAPEFPQQVTDVSFGLTQNAAVTDIITSTQDAKILIPTGQPNGTWNEVGFDDASWQNGSASIGYQEAIPGFTVQDAKGSSSIVNLAEATAVLNGVGQASQEIVVSPVVNFIDAEGGGGFGNFDADSDFPNDTLSDDNDFAVRATGTITIPSTGPWTFGTNSDDGVRVKINGQTVIDDDTLHAPQDRFGTIQLSAGQHQLELVFFERGGGAEVELFAASGTRTSFSTRFDLIGDTARGGLQVETSPSGGAVGFAGLVQTDVGDLMRDRASTAYMRIPFDIEDPSELETLTLRMNYDDGFVAYLNGEEVARRNSPAQANFNSTSLTDRAQSSALTAENIGLSQHLSLLQAGENVLAIHGLNDSIDSGEFLLSASLFEARVSAGEPVYFVDPTPGDFNASQGVQEFLLDDVTFSQPHGFYEEAFEVEIISAAEGTNVRYTVDGSEPTETNGVAYDGPVTIDSTTTIRARSFKADTEPSRTATATYLFLDDVLTQSPDGNAPENWPTSKNINGQTLDYGMDPDIVNSATWGPQLKEALTQIPSMSVVMDVDDFIGSRNGIYTHAGSHGKAWERPASLELINPDGTEGFQVEMGIRIRGGFSRSGSNPKHAFRLFFRDEYGDAKLEYPLFGDEGVDSFDKIDLRTTQNYSWSFQGDGRNTFLRDIFSRDVQGMLGQPYTRGRYYHLYMNGQYWGIFQTEERPEARYAAANFGGDSDDYDVVKSAGSSGGYQNEATDGNLDAYRRLSEFFYQQNGLSDENMADYYRAQGLNLDGTRNDSYERLLDVDSLIDYMLITYFTSDADGPGSKFTRPRVNNYFSIYNRTEPDGFKFFEHDSEHSLDTGNAAGANYNMVTPLTTGGAQFRYFNPHWMHEQLAKENTVYRERFADRVYEQLFHDGVLTPESANAIIDARAAQFDMAIIAESARWGDSKRTTPFTKTNWDRAVGTLRDFFDGRAQDVLRQLQGQDWYPDENPPQFLVNGTPQHGGDIGASDQIGLAAESSFQYDTILRKGSVWSYLDDGSNQGTAWRAADFDDATWDSGRAQLGYGQNGLERTVVSFGGNSSNKHRTTYFRTTFEVDNPTEYVAGRINIVRDDGAIVYLNGEEIARSNMPSGTVNFRTFAASTVGGGNETAEFVYEFPTSLLRAGENTLAVEVHQVNASSSDLSFDMDLQLGKVDTAGSGIYYTLDGSDPKMQDGELNPNAVEFDQFLRLAANREIAVRARGDDGTWSVLNRASFTVDDQGMLGDLDADGDIDAADIDLLTAAIRGNDNNVSFDINSDGSVTTDDVTFLVEDVLGTRRGDVDLNGTVGFSDFLALSQNFGTTGGWADGNFDTDTQVGFTDFLVVSQNFGFVAAAARAQAVATIDAAEIDAAMSEPESDELPFFASLDDDDETDLELLAADSHEAGIRFA